MFSTAGISCVQWEISRVHWGGGEGVFSTLAGYHEYTGDIIINVGEGLWENN